MGLDALDNFFMFVAFAFGATVGSFLNVVIYRLPKDLSVVSPPSSCPKCNVRIKFYDNIPLLSWFALGGRSRCCGERISWQYPLVELVTALLFFAIYWLHGPTVATPVYMLLGAALVAVTFIDIYDWIIPNEITYPGVPLGIAWGLVVMFMGESSGGVIPGAYEDVFDALFGAAAGFLSLYLIDKACLFFLGKRGMGGGDPKLLAVLGAFLGWQSVLVIFVMASFSGAIIGYALMLATRQRGAARPEPAGPDDDDEPIPEGNYMQFGPHLAAAGVAMMLFGEPIMAFIYDYYFPASPVQLI